MPLFLSQFSARSLSATFMGVVIVAFVFLNSNWENEPSLSPRSADAEAQALSSNLPQQIIGFCGNCHAVPSPDTFPSEAWDDEVRKGYKFYADSGRSDLAVPPIRDVIAWYKARAPVELTAPVPVAQEAPAAVLFRQVPVAFPSGEQFSAVSYVRWVEPMEGSGGHLVFCDMNSGHINSVSFSDGMQSESLGRLSNPAHVEVTDLDGDQRHDFVIAELGSLMPADHNNGKVIWLHQPENQDEFVPLVIQEGLGRVADVRPGDFDNDGDIDLVVAEFGWRSTGRILLLENRGLTGARPEFMLRVLDERHGAIHVPVADLNGDGHLDFVALVSQEYETVDAFLNRGDGTFQRERIFDAGDPSFGSSGIELVDLDNDGDLDVLYTNGDTVDSFYLKPYHAIRWLENQGAYPYQQHELTAMPGVYRAVVGDLDGDGDTDIVACAYVPPRRSLANPPDQKLDTLVWMEQTQPGTFTRHSLSKDFGYVALDVDDFDRDGDIDIAVGNYFQMPRDPWLTVWLNLATDL